jgi:hypothetical protein
LLLTFYPESALTDKTSVIVMTVVGNAPQCGEPLWKQIDALPAPPGFCWRFVPEGPFAVQVRSILRAEPRAVVVWVGVDDAVDRAANLILRVCGAGPPIVIAVAEVHDPPTESALRQAGALYICANEARQRLGSLMESILGPPPPSIDPKSIGSTQEVKMDAG